MLGRRAPLPPSASMMLSVAAHAAVVAEWPIAASCTTHFAIGRFRSARRRRQPLRTCIGRQQLHAPPGGPELLEDALSLLPAEFVCASLVCRPPTRRTEPCEGALGVDQAVEHILGQIT